MEWINFNGDDVNEKRFIIGATSVKYIMEMMSNIQYDIEIDELDEEDTVETCGDIIDIMQNLTEVR